MRERKERPLAERPPASGGLGVALRALWPGHAAGKKQALRRALEESAEGLALYDPAGRLVSGNPAFAAFLRAADQEPLAAPGAGLDDLRAALAAWPGAEEGVGPGQEDWSLDLPWGEGARALRGERLPDGGTLLHLRDSSRIREELASLRERERRYRTMVESSSQGILIHREGKALFVNRALARMHGYDSPEEILGLPSAWVLMAPHERERVKRYASARLSGGEAPASYIIEGVTRDGATLWIHMTVRLIEWEGAPAIQCLAIDVSEQKRAEAALRRSEEHFRSVVEDQTELICRYLPDGRLTFVNGAYCRFFGGTPQTLLGSDYVDTLPEAEQQAERDYIASLVADPRIVSYERSQNDQLGRPRWLEWTDRPLTNEAGRVVELQAVAHDITDRKSMEAALRRSEERYRSVVDDQMDLLCRYRRDTIITFVNRAYCRYYGKEPQELIGRSFLDFVPRDEHAFVCDKIAQLVETRGSLSYERKAMTPSGEVRWQQWNDRVLLDEQGRVAEIQAVGRDVTERRIVEQRFRAFVENAPAAISVKDRQGRFLLVNRRFSETVGLSPDDVVGRRASEVFPADFAESGREHDWVILTSGRASMREESLRVADNLMTFLTVKFPILDDAGQINTIAAIHTDISALKQAEVALAEAKEEAERANAAKTRFLAAASHDLRQPLHAMRLLLETLAGVEEETRRTEITRHIGAALASMSTMLNALLDIGELETGTVKPKLSDFDIDDVIQGLMTTALPQAEEKGIEVRHRSSGLVVRSDPTLLGRVLDNFLSNALRYTERGGILIGCRLRGDRVRIEIWDSGIGIPEDKLEAIFEDYHQLGNPGRDRSKGLGLGLGIADRLARLLGHRIEAHSRLERGSVFAIEVPRGELPLPQVEPKTAGWSILKPETGSLLLIEDDPMVADATRSLLERWHYQVRQVADAPGALALLEETPGWTPDVIIADYRLPQEASGIEAIAALRAATGHAIPAIVVTGDQSAEIYEEAEAAGHRVIKKPVEPAKLRSLLRACLRERNKDAPAAAAASLGA